MSRPGPTQSELETLLRGLPELIGVIGTTPEGCGPAALLGWHLLRRAGLRPWLLHLQGRPDLAPGASETLRARVALHGSGHFVTACGAFAADAAWRQFDPQAPALILYPHASIGQPGAHPAARPWARQWQTEPGARVGLATLAYRVPAPLTEAYREACRTIRSLP